MKEFKKSLIESKSNYFGITAYLKEVSSGNNLTFKNEITSNALKTLKLKWPGINLDYINKILNYLKNNN